MRGGGSRGFNSLTTNGKMCSKGNKALIYGKIEKVFLFAKLANLPS